MNLNLLSVVLLSVPAFALAHGDKAPTQAPAPVQAPAPGKSYESMSEYVIKQKKAPAETHADHRENEDDHAAALGYPGDAKNVTRTIKVKMQDSMRFSPDRIEVTQGETIRFQVSNVGNLKHELVLGTQEELNEHAEMMRKFPEMQHADPNAATLASGESGELIWTFDKTGRFDFACLVPGHMEAGMVGKIVVVEP